MPNDSPLAILKDFSNSVYGSLNDYPTSSPLFSVFADERLVAGEAGAEGVAVAAELAGFVTGAFVSLPVVAQPQAASKETRTSFFIALPFG